MWALLCWTLGSAPVGAAERQRSLVPKGMGLARSYSPGFTFPFGLGHWPNRAELVARGKENWG